MVPLKTSAGLLVVKLPQDKDICGGYGSELFFPWVGVLYHDNRIAGITIGGLRKLVGLCVVVPTVFV
jgi:hypothetical protein